jgi:fructokinase
MNVKTRVEEIEMIICCGEALVDMAHAQVSGLGEVYLPHPGGSPFNTAVAIGRMGVPVKFLGRLSNDLFGEMLIKRLRESKVGDELILRSAKNSSLAFVKPEKNKESKYVFYADDTAERSLSVEDLPIKLPDNTKCIVFGSISMTMEPIASAIESLILREGSRKNTDQMDGAPVISFDPNIRPHMIKDKSAYIAKFEKWVASSTIAKISAADFAFLYPKLDPGKALQKVLSMGPWLSICTMGNKGALALLRRSDGNVIKVFSPSVNLPLVDTIGAGDTFHGAFLSWLMIKDKMSRSAIANLSEEELFNALFFANKAAAIDCSRRGADPPSRREVDSLKIQPPKQEGKAEAAGKTASKKTATTPKAAAEKPKTLPQKKAVKKK